MNRIFIVFLSFFISSSCLNASSGGGGSDDTPPWGVHEGSTISTAAAAVVTTTPIPPTINVKERLVNDAVMKTSDLLVEKLTKCTRDNIRKIIDELNPTRLAYETSVYLRAHPTLNRMTSDLLLKKMIIAFCFMREVVITQMDVLKCTSEQKIESACIIKTFTDPICTLINRSYTLKQQSGQLANKQIKELRRYFLGSHAIPANDALLKIAFRGDISEFEKGFKRFKMMFMLHHGYDLKSALVMSQKPQPLLLDLKAFRNGTKNSASSLTDAAVFGCPFSFLYISHKLSNLMTAGNKKEAIPFMKKMRFCHESRMRNNMACNCTMQGEYEQAAAWKALAVEEGYAYPTQGQSGVKSNHSATEPVEMDTIYTVSNQSELLTMPLPLLEKTANSFYASGQHSEAIKYFEGIVKREPKVKWVESLIECYHLVENHDQALRVAQQHAALNSPAVCVELGVQAYNDGRYEEAVRSFSRVGIDGIIACPMACYAFATSYFNLSDIGKSENIINKCLLKNHKFSPDIELLRADIAGSKGNLKEKLRILQEAYPQLQKDDHEHKPLFNVYACAIANILIKRGVNEHRPDDFDQALSYLKDCLADNDIKVKEYWGVIKYYKTQYEDAISALKNVDTMRANAVLGEIYKARGELENAIPKFKRALHHGCLPAALPLASCYEKCGQIKRAERYFKMSVRYGLEGAVNLYADFLNERDRIEEARIYNAYCDDDQADSALSGCSAAAAAAEVSDDEPANPVMSKKFVRRTLRDNKKDAPQDFANLMAPSQESARSYKDLVVKCVSSTVQLQIDRHELRIQGLLSALVNGAQRAGHLERLKGYDNRYSMRITHSDRLVIEITEGGINAPGGLKEIVIILAEGHYTSKKMKAKVGDSAQHVVWSETDDDSGSGDGDI